MADYFELPGLSYELGGKIRSLPISEAAARMIMAAAYATDPNLRVVVSSGGQQREHSRETRGKPGGWTGSHRHDVDESGYSQTADVILMQDGKRVTPGSNKQLYADFLRNAAAVGFTGLGHYSWGVHVGGGSQAAWGPSKSSRDLDPFFGDAISEGWAEAKKGVGQTLLSNYGAQVPTPRSNIPGGPPLPASMSSDLQKRRMLQAIREVPPLPPPLPRARPDYAGAPEPLPRPASRMPASFVRPGIPGQMPAGQPKQAAQTAAQRLAALDPMQAQLAAYIERQRAPKVGSVVRPEFPGQMPAKKPADLGPLRTQLADYIDRQNRPQVTTAALPEPLTFNVREIPMGGAQPLPAGKTLNPLPPSRMAELVPASRRLDATAQPSSVLQGGISGLPQLLMGADPQAPVPLPPLRRAPQPLPQPQSSQSIPAQMSEGVQKLQEQIAAMMPQPSGEPSYFEQMTGNKGSRFSALDMLKSMNAERYANSQRRGNRSPETVARTIPGIGSLTTSSRTASQPAPSPQPGRRFDYNDYPGRSLSTPSGSPFWSYD